MFRHLSIQNVKRSQSFTKLVSVSHVPELNVEVK